MSARKPEPIAELVITSMNAADRVFHITVATEDAREWIDREAPAYGHLFREPFGKGQYTFIVLDTYRPQDVLNYLRSYCETSE